MDNLRNLTKRLTFILLLSLLLTGALPSRALRAQDNEKELFLVAQKAFEDGFYDVAMRYIDQLFVEYPSTDKRIQANLLLGQCYFFKNQYLKAYEIFQDLLQYSEYQDATLFWIAETYLKGSDYKQAEEHYQKLIERFPNSIYAPQTYYSLGWAHFAQSRYQKAKDTFFILTRTFPSHQLSEDASFKLGEIEFNLQSYETTVKTFQKYLISYPQSTKLAECHFYIAESYYYLNNPLAAVTYYAKAADLSYDNNLTLMSKVSLGWSYIKLKKYTLAQQSFDSALVFAQEKGIVTDDIYLGQANLYSETKEYTKALEAYQQLISNFPNSNRIIEAHLGVANIQYTLKKYPDAIDVYQKIINEYDIKSKPEELLEKTYFGLAWAQLKNGRIYQAIKSFEEIKDKTKSQTVKISALTQIGDAYQDTGKFEQALRIYDRILEEYPDSLYADYVQHRQGIALLKMDKLEAATMSFQSLQANFPQSKYLTDIKYYLAVAYFKKEDWKAARRYIKEFIAATPSHSEFLAESNYILALSEFNLENYDVALKSFQKIIRNYPTQSSLVRTSEISIAKCLYKLDNEKEAIKKLKLIVFKYPESEMAQEATILLGNHFLQTSDFDKAISYYLQFVADYPGSDELNIVRYTLGQAYQAKGDYTNAVETLNKITESDKQLYAKARLLIADIFSRDLDTDSAIGTYRNIIATSPQYKRDAYVKIAQVYLNTKDYDKSIKSYKNALDADQGSSEHRNSELQFYVGDTYEISNQAQQAIEEYLKIPYLYPNDKKWVVKSYLRAAKIFEESEEWTEAATIYNKIIDLKTDEIIFAQERLEWIANNVDPDI